MNYQPIFLSFYIEVSSLKSIVYINFQDTTMEPLSKEEIKNIFQEIDKDKDGFISRHDL